MLLEDRIRPAFRRCGLLDGVAEADFGIRGQRVAHQHVGVRLTLVSEHFDAVVHAAGPIPAVFDDAERSVLKLEDRDRFVLALRTIAVDLRRHLRVHAPDLGLAKKPPAKGDAVAAEVHHRPTARLRDVPEPVGVRSGVLLSLFYEVDATERSLIRHLFRLHVLRRKEQLLGVQQQHARLAAGVDHRVGLLQRDTQRLLADDVLPRFGGVDRDLRVQTIRGGNRDELDLRISEQFVVVRVGCRDAVSLREARRLSPGRRRDPDHFAFVGHHLYRVCDAVRLKARAYDADFYFGHVRLRCGLTADLRRGD